MGGEKVVVDRSDHDGSDETHGMRIKARPVLDDSHLQDGEDGVPVERVIASKELGEQMEGQGPYWDDERDLRAELHDYYSQYYALERRRLRLIYAAQQTVLVEGKSNVDPGTLVMILNLARLA